MVLPSDVGEIMGSPCLLDVGKRISSQASLILFQIFKSVVFEFGAHVDDVLL